MNDDPDPTGLLDRFRGSLLGLALGDALGAPYEFSHPPVEVAAEFRTGYFGTAPGHPTDDSTLALFCAEALVEEGDFAAGYVRRLLSWAEAHPPDIGNQTRFAVLTWSEGVPPPADERAQGNGSLMAMAPIGLRHVLFPATALERARSFAAVTHPSTVAAETNAGFAAMLGAAVLDDQVPPAPAVPDGTQAHGHYMGWCQLTLHLARGALDAAERDGPFAALRAVVALGGDTDTNAAVAGALLGARYGTAAWPAALLDGLALRAQLEELARDLAILAEVAAA